mmetsp:Transcript_33800/g.44615  ORF Transcript_33800/g.44615 Transcript_33800/m.44615 type:complete len:215 (+) Transcript_33800:803-1447(+)
MSRFEQFFAAVREQVHEHLLSERILGGVRFIHCCKVGAARADFTESILELLVELGLLLLFRQVVGLTLDEANSVGFLGRDVNFFIGGLGLAEANVGLDVRVKKHGLLHDVAALLTELKHIVVVQVLSIDQHLSLVDVVEAEQNVDQGRLAAARVADECDLGASGYVHVELVHHSLSASWVVKVNALELNLAVCHRLDVAMLGLPDVESGSLVDD